MLLARSTDHEKMRRILQVIRELSSLAHLSEVAQDNLYASIARSHPKALLHLEAGNTAAAMKEMAGAVSCFLRRFPDDLNSPSLTKRQTSRLSCEQPVSWLSAARF